MSAWPRQPTEADTLFARSLERIFAEYPPSVTKTVTDPLTGMQRNAKYAKFPPTVPQIVEALNHEMNIFRSKTVQSQVKRLDREREADSNKIPLNPETLGYWLNRDPATMPDPIPSRNAPRVRAPAFRPLAEIAAENGGSEEQLDAMPYFKHSTGPPRSPFMTPEDEDVSL